MLPWQRIHGEWQISLVGNVLIRTFAGNFNDAGTLACYEEFKEKAPKDRPWASLADGRFWEMSTQSALQTYQGMRDWAFENGCEHIVFILPSKFHKIIVERETQALSDPRYHLCFDLEHACERLTALGFPLSPETYPHTEFAEKARRHLSESA